MGLKRPEYFCARNAASQLVKPRNLQGKKVHEIQNVTKKASLNPSPYFELPKITTPAHFVFCTT